ncbi:MAG TPA: hypothetical protein PK890_09760 [Terrimesophilobacter sp.]|nr:hypothetical protein [Terrimesophilobacter sp.]
MLNGTCNINVGMDDEQVTIGVGAEAPGTPSTGGSGGPVAAPREGEICNTVGGVTVCRALWEASGPVTLSDIAHFRPSPGRNLMEPDGWMIVGLHTNFYAHANQHIVAGQLWDEPAWVRFTPVGYRWWYGDGGTHYSGTKGNTWANLGLDEFDATPNSHVYRSAGTYYIDLSIVYRAEYRFAGDSFIPIDGTLPLPANRLVAVAGDAVTVLVEHDCAANPMGPGC